MRVRYVRLRNFLSHRDTSIELGDGLTVISGPNGAGKTAILDALSYSLFKQHSRGDEEALINKSSQSAELEVTFSASGREYLVKWSIKRKGKASASLWDMTAKRPIIIDGGERSVIPEIERIVGMSSSIFLNAIYVRQGEISKLLDVKPAERKRIITELLGIDVLEKIWDSLRLPIKQLEERLALYESAAARVVELENRIVKINDEVSMAKGELEKLKRIIEDDEGKLKRLRVEIERLEESRRSYEVLLRELEKLEREVAVKSQQLRAVEEKVKIAEMAEAEVAELGELYKRYDDLSSELDELNSRLQHLRAKRAEKLALKGSLKRVEREIREDEEALSEVARVLRSVGEYALSDELADAVRRALKRLENRLSEIEGELEEADKQLGILEGEVKIREENVAKLRVAGNRCPLCGQELTQLHRESITKRLREEMINLGDEISKLRLRRARLDELRKEVKLRREELLRIGPERVEEIMKRLEGNRSEFNKLSKEVEELKVVEEEIEGLSEEIAKKKDELEDLSEAREKYLRYAGVLEQVGDTSRLLYECNKIKAELAEKAIKVERLKREISGLSFSEDEYEDKRTKLRELEGRVSELRVDEARLVERISSLGSELLRLEAELGEAREAKHKYEKLSKKLELLKVIREAFGKDGVQRVARLAAKKGIESNTRRFLRAFSIEYGDVRLDEDYNIYLYGKEGEMKIESLSGGEKIAVALALRLGIAASLAGDRIECIIMDEPTIHLDADKRRELARLLSNFKSGSELLPQAIVITHDREMEEVADSLYEIAKSGGYSVANKHS